VLKTMIQVNTFSIVAYDAKEQAWGVAVASKFLAVGSLVSWAQAGIGAVATQALAKVGYGPDGLALMADGMSASEALAKLLADDPKRETRQIGIVDAKGGAAAHTGENCHSWAGHLVGQGFTCQGNILVGEVVLQTMASTYRATQGELANRLVAALAAGDRVGGDRRGKQSAAVLVVRPNGGYGGDTDRYLDLRVDDHPEPVSRLKELLDMHQLFFGVSRPNDMIPITPDIARQLQAILLKLDYMTGEADGKWDTLSKQALWEMVGNENLEERWNLDGDTDKIDRVVLEYLQNRFGSSGG
jgi:uncharacterized Ntn-hydrolase superfamily protein